ncbi:flagellar protein FlgN [Magnetococcus sp. PR-3]|uniref:flagellar protein FlgN n=1 Tax=Magnetococcus sp. PR-3 TaxID=3120355 RepID=UPI002FCDEE90
MQATMQEHTSALIGVMDELNEHFQKVLGLFERERDALSRRDIEEMENTSATIGQALEDARVIEVRRQHFTGNLAQNLGMPARGAKWDQLTSRLDTDDARPLRKARNRLRATLFAVEHANRMNQAAFRGVQAATDSILNILHGGNGSYDRSGTRQQASTGATSFLSKQL